MEGGGAGGVVVTVVGWWGVFISLPRTRQNQPAEVGADDLGIGDRDWMIFAIRKITRFRDKLV